MSRKLHAKPAASQDKLPPHSVEAEQGVLGCILLAPDDCLEECLEKLKPGRRAFYELRHQTLFQTLIEMHSEGHAIDLITLHNWLDSKRLIEAAGGLGYISSLSDAVPSAANLNYYVEIVLEKYELRKRLQICQSVIDRIDDHEGPSGDILRLIDSELSDVAAAGNSDFPPIVDTAKLLSEKQAPPPEIISGVLHQGGKLALSGASKSFKTWTLLDLGISVAFGEPWLSFKTNRGRVLYLNFELPGFAIQERIQSILTAKSVKVEAGRLDVWNLRGHSSDINTLTPKIITAGKRTAYVLIVLDPIYKCYGARMDENAAGDVAQLLRSIDRLAVQTGAAIAFGNHFAKGNAAAKESIDRASGSGVFARDPDAIISLTRHEKENAFSVECTLRSFKPVEPFAARWDWPLMRRDNDLDPARLRKPGGRKQEHDETDLLSVLPDGGLTNTEWISQAEEQHGISRRTFYRLRGALLQAERVINSKVSGRWTPIKAKA